jgi:hypothetical protein
MTHITRLACSLILGLFICQGAHASLAGGITGLLQATGFIEEFDGDWSVRWVEERLAASPTSYGVVDDGDESVLRAESQGGAAALVRRVRIPASGRGRIAWRWRLGQSISAARDHEERGGDDYSGRVFVIFDGDFGDSDARALCYVWAEHLPIGSVFPSPYSDRVAMVVVAGSPSRGDEWISVQRDFIADYLAFFGESPGVVTGVAILVDTDNTDSEATMFLDRVELDIRPQTLAH